MLWVIVHSLLRTYAAAHVAIACAVALQPELSHLSRGRSKSGIDRSRACGLTSIGGRPKALAPIDRRLMSNVSARSTIVGPAELTRGPHRVLGDRYTIQRMLELYQHDLSDIWDQDLDSQGVGYALDRYWDTEDFPLCRHRRR